MSTPSTSVATPAGNPARKKALTALSIVVLLGLVYGGFEYYGARHSEETDNAYVQGNVIQITPQVGGTVTAIMADDTDFVKAGQALVKLDPADARVALDQAEANLAQAVRQVRTLYANNGSLSAQVTLRESDIAKAQTEIARATDDLNRRQALAGNGAVSKEELNHAKSQLSTAQNALAAAQAGVAAAREQLSSNQTLTDGTSVEGHPSVVAASAKVREAFLALHRAELPAPVDGYVAKRTVQLGQRVAAGAPLMSIIPLNQVWVDANFKEVQLRNIRIGQPVTLTADLYGKKMEYKGTVAGLGVGTGAAFSLLPAQNATGNWIKVVQRVPVRVTLDAEQLAQNPLRVGLSMEATVDVTDQSGKSLADAPRTASVTQTDVYTVLDQQANAEVRKVIASNLGRGVKANVHAAAKPGTGV
ncbi:MAG: hemolysin D [Curvibacter sp. RIFCSPHIGHO2_12_FULL_63_18]|uniref:HlyD family secretion protein n=1 Tax=Rhodoferax sp. TaxID=50421 RepID=UPI0008D848CD|nr:HlyD family efflux transporter periplasmic adaptor subunit [Rhodoferax sp.]OGO94997.1 MAG: hemolysin D [Curvibacter sp. GWA2_63_95]OGP05189.1 MAG: hemolysin D [Curvibacter sp. RIFCSPHIGHO2_12_FULL_63_18]HCX82326.1 EmrA/EmrK family multidrug efflux transporter periplasmic adaptor subunit [Rhodoferax sp.]